MLAVRPAYVHVSAYIYFFCFVSILDWIMCDVVIYQCACLSVHIRRGEMTYVHVHIYWTLISLQKMRLPKN